MKTPRGGHFVAPQTIEGARDRDSALARPRPLRLDLTPAVATSLGRTVADEVKISGWIFRERRATRQSWAN